MKLRYGTQVGEKPKRIPGAFSTALKIGAVSAGLILPFGAVNPVFANKAPMSASICPKTGEQNMQALPARGKYASESPYGWLMALGALSVETLCMGAISVAVLGAKLKSADKPVSTRPDSSWHFYMPPM